MTFKHTSELQALIAAINPEDIWRPVFDGQGQVLATGKGYTLDGICAETGVDFKGKTVADLGSNVGHFSRLAARHGARKVWGYERDERLNKIAALQTAQQGLDNVHFYTHDFLTQQPKQTAHMAMLVDIIGKEMVATGDLRRYPHALPRYGRKELILTVRPMYRIRKDLQTTAQDLESLYGVGFTAAGHFLVLRYVLHTFAPEWRLVRLHHELGNHSKIPLRFVRKEA